MSNRALDKSEGLSISPKFHVLQCALVAENITPAYVSVDACVLEYDEGH